MLTAQSTAIPQQGVKRLVLLTLIGTYAWCGRLRSWRIGLAESAAKLFSYIRGVHLWVKEKTTVPPVESLRLVTVSTGNSSFKMALVTPGFIEDRIVADGCWEPQLMELMAVLMRPKSVFLDVGANIGFHSLHIAARNPEARCHAFEPHSEIFLQLTRNARLSALGNLVLHSLALGETRHDGVFYVQDGRAYNRGLSSSVQNDDLKERWQRVPMLFETLDGALNEMDRRAVSLIKIDTQGTEREVLAGARNIISEARPSILFEFESRYHADPEQEIHKILSLLPNYEVFYLQTALGSMKRFNACDVRDKRFEADLVCLPI